MKHKMIKCILSIALILTLFTTNLVNAININILECSCDNIELTLVSHSDDCDRKQSGIDIANYSVDEIMQVWGVLSEDMKEWILTYLSWIDDNKLTELNTLLEI